MSSVLQAINSMMLDVFVAIFRKDYDELLTEMQLGRQMLNRYGIAYNRMQAIDKRKQMMIDWANYLDDIKAGNFYNFQKAYA